MGLFGEDEDSSSENEKDSSLDEDLEEVGRMDEAAQEDPEGFDQYTTEIDELNAEEFPDGDGEV